MSDQAEVTVTAPEYWAEHVGDLARKHLTSASGSRVVGHPTAGPVDSKLKAVLTAPRLWLDYPDALREGLLTASRALKVPPEERLVFTVEEAAALLGISRSFAYEAAARGDISTIHVGRRILVPKAALERLLAGDQGQ